MKKHRSPNTEHRSLSVVLATRNEELNVADCLVSVKDFADEVIVVDESSIDRTREIAKKFGAKVYKVKHEPIFHKTKQKALDLATGDWILQLDADERVSPELAKEIKNVINMDNKKLLTRKFETLQKNKLFVRHQKLIEKRDGIIGKKNGEVVAFFIPRRNYFLGRPLIHAGVYPDGVIRLIKRDKARFPAKSVHEQIEIDGEVSWLSNDLEHHDSPTFSRYLARLNRYTDLKAEDFKRTGAPHNMLFLIHYSFMKPLYLFLLLFFRHKGFLDGTRGFLWSLFSALHFPIAYFKYWQIKEG